MEGWEAAVLAGGGILLVLYMTRQQSGYVASVKGTAAAGVSPKALGSVGVTNASNLTNITNTAGGLPAIAGETLSYRVPPVALPVSGPYQMTPNPVLQPILSHPVLPGQYAMPVYRTPVILNSRAIML